MKFALTVTAAALLASAPFAASAQPPGAQWAGDVCHQGGPKPEPGAQPPQCLPYPPRIKAHDNPCQWVSEVYDGAAHEFEVCREHDGVWRPSGRS
jgi:hypothetical protein